jgi:hypothetical protein
MTTEERLDRIELITAGIAEERRKDRDEYKTLLRETQRHITDLAAGMVDLRRQVSDLAVETRIRFEELADESHDADRRLGERIDSLVSAIGQFISQGRPPQ